MNFNEDIKAYIDGELSPERTEEVRIALEQDPELMEEYTSMKSISQKLQSLVRQPQVKGVEQTKSAVAPVRRFRWREGLAVAATLVIIGAIMFPVFTKAKYAAKKSDAVVLATSPADEAKSLGGFDRNGFPNDQGANALKDERFDSMRGGAGAAGAEDVTSNGVGSSKRVASGFNDGLSLGMGAPTEPPIAIDGVQGVPKLKASGTNTIPATQSPNEIIRPNDAEFEARFVIKDGSFTILVKDVREAMDKATQLARTNGGYIEASNIEESGDKKGPTTGYLTIRLPQKNFEAAVEKVRSYGEIKSENTSGDDVTGQVTDIEARIRTLKAEEESYRELLRRATRLGDILDIKDRISQVRQQIESYDSQRMMLSRLSALSTLSLRFTTDKDAKKVAPVDNEEDAEWFDDTKLAALGILKGIGKFIAQVATFVFILLPVWVPVVLFLLWFRRRAFVPTT